MPEIKASNDALDELKKKADEFKEAQKKEEAAKARAIEAFARYKCRQCDHFVECFVSGQAKNRIEVRSSIKPASGFSTFSTMEAAAMGVLIDDIEEGAVIVFVGCKYWELSPEYGVQTEAQGQ